MSWGEISCSKRNAPKNKYGGCTVATFETCNKLCPFYTNDKNLTKTQKRLLNKHNKEQ
jgi:ribosomal protein L31